MFTVTMPKVCAKSNATVSTTITSLVAYEISTSTAQPNIGEAAVRMNRLFANTGSPSNTAHPIVTSASSSLLCNWAAASVTEGMLDTMIPKKALPHKTNVCSNAVGISSPVLNSMLSAATLVSEHSFITIDPPLSSPEAGVPTIPHQLSEPCDYRIVINATGNRSDGTLSYEVFNSVFDDVTIDSDYVFSVSATVLVSGPPVVLSNNGPPTSSNQNIVSHFGDDSFPTGHVVVDFGISTTNGREKGYRILFCSKSSCGHSFK